MTIDIKELRRLTQAALAGPDGISLNWLKLLQDFQQKVSPAAVIELLDRLEEAKTAWKEADKACRDLTEKVIPNLRESLEAAEKDIALKERVIDALGSELNVVANERDALRTALEKIADWDSAWGPYPETNEAWRAMVIVTAREAVPRRGEEK